MKILRNLALVIAAVCFLSTAVLAAEASTKSSAGNTSQNQSENSKDKNADKKGCDFHKDPIKALEERKADIQKKLKEGSISKEEADKKIARIDEKIKKIQEFNKLSVPEKKEKLKNDFKDRINKKLKEGKISQDKANELIKDFNKRIEEWDGNGFPKFHMRGMKEKGSHDNLEKKN